MYLFLFVRFNQTSSTGFNLIYLSTQITFVLFSIVVGILFFAFFGACTCATIAEPSVGVFFVTMLIVVFGIFGFMIFYYYKQLKFIQCLSITLESGTDDYKKHFKFIYVVQWVMVVILAISVISFIPLIGNIDMINATLKDMISDLDLGDSITFYSYVSIGIMSVIASIISLATQILYLVGLKKFDENYQVLEK